MELDRRTLLPGAAATAGPAVARPAAAAAAAPEFRHGVAAGAAAVSALAAATLLRRAPGARDA